MRIGDNMPRDVGDIGFPIELHPRDPDTAWVFPMDGTDVWPRTSPDGRPAAYVHARRAARRGRASTRACPTRAWFTVKRQAMTHRRRRSGRRVLRHDERARCGRAPTRARRGAASPRTCPRSTRVETSREALNVRIPTPLRSYTAQQSVVDADGATVDEVLRDLDAPLPGHAVPHGRRAGQRAQAHEGVRQRRRRARPVDAARRRPTRSRSCKRCPAADGVGRAGQPLEVVVRPRVPAEVRRADVQLVAVHPLGLVARERRGRRRRRCRGGRGRPRTCTTPCRTGGRRAPSTSTRRRR